MRADGTEFPIEASISQTRDIQDCKLYTGMLRGITERVRAETAVRHSRENFIANREEEKRRVARELHDDIGQRLSAFKMDLVMREEDLHGERVSATSMARAAAMHGAIDAAIAAVHQISADLRPALLDELGLAAALDWPAEDVTRRYDIAITLHTPDHVDTTELRATAVFRIAQEALNNVAHHAYASYIWSDL